MELRPRHWWTALALALAIHVATLALFYPPTPMFKSNAKTLNLAAYEITLGATPVAPDNANTIEKPNEVQQVKTETASPDPPPLETPKLQTQPTLKPEFVPQAAGKAAPQRRLIEPPTETSETAAPKIPSKVVAAALTADDTRHTPTKTSPQTIGANNGRISPNNAAKKKYFAQLNAWLEKYKQYPRRARRRHQQGTAYLRFVIDRDGQVLSYEIERSSGYPLLDEEAERILRRAQPLPAMPEGLVLSRLELVVPVSFYMH